MQPTQRSLQLWRARGWRVYPVERWVGPPPEPGEKYNPRRRRVDFGGFADLIAYRRGEVVAIQTTSHEGMRARLRKFRKPADEEQREASAALFDWLEGDVCRFVVEGWKKHKDRVAGRQWRETVVEVRQADLPLPPPDEEDLARWAEEDGDDSSPGEAP